ncbi:MAG TPA: hypothetical protein VGQ48_04260 [Gemmatimonadales bacterium]|jgi:hypothetical protein|nr:hypothetical protein [Gemmatimonadales bacterium]
MNGNHAMMLFLIATFACGGDKSTGPGGVSFPSIPQATLNQYCIRGQAVPPQTKSGSIATSDCHDAAGSPYYEIYRVRVGSSDTVTFRVSSSFDSYLYLIRIDNLSDIEGSAVLLASDDDSAGNLDAMLSYTLQPNTEYFILISGLDDTETGSYSLAITR